MHEEGAAEWKIKSYHVAKIVDLKNMQAFQKKSIQYYEQHTPSNIVLFQKQSEPNGMLKGAMLQGPISTLVFPPPPPQTEELNCYCSQIQAIFTLYYLQKGII